MRGAENFVSQQTSVSLTGDFDVMVNSEELNEVRDYIRYNRVRVYLRT